MTLVQSLRPRVTREEAVALLTPRGASGWFRRMRLGPLRSVAQVYVPYRLYRVHINSKKGEETRYFGIDGVTGALDLYGFDSPLMDDESTLNVRTRNVPECALSQEQSAAMLTTKVQRILFQTGFFKMLDMKITPELIGEIHIPYWVGFFGAGESADVAVIDAVRRTLEGARARQLVRDWLTTPAN